MPTNTIIPFTIEIKEARPDGSFLVEYFPTDGHCSPVLHNISVPLELDLTREELLTYLADRSPQEHWQQLLAIKFADLSNRQAMVGAVQENAEQLMARYMPHLVSNPTGNQ
jgi:hypothetical protein